MANQSPPRCCHVARSLGVAAVVSTLLVGCQPWTSTPLAPQPLFGPPAVGQTSALGSFSNETYDANGQPMYVQPHVYADAAPPSVVQVPVLDRQWAWEQLVDTVDDYFRIESERQVQLVGDVITEGRIDTFPQIGATVLEPHRPDSVGRYNRWESTFQTIRRRATLRVVPEANGYLIEAIVNKELEDLPRPEGSTAGAATFRNDDSLVTRRIDDVSRTELSGNWIMIGRDVDLEQALLAEIHMRMAQTKPPGVLRR